jgi:DNA-directed RNA polymerase specialized sigma24 family protein
MPGAKGSAGELRTGGGFPPTRWSLVLHAAHTGSPEADSALARLCEAYWYPLYAFLRHQGHPPAEAEDFTQEFLSRLVHKHYLEGLTQEGGKFRSFLLIALKRFLANERDRENAQKRGGGKALISIDAAAELRYQRELIDHATPDTLFERQWAFTVMDRVLDRVLEEYSRAGKRELFERLQGCLPGANGQVPYAASAAALQMKESSVRMAALRLRRRYGQLLREEIAETVTSPREVEEEIRHLIEVAGSF